MADTNETLTDGECVALCGALRRMMLADRYASGPEREALFAIVAELAPSVGALGAAVPGSPEEAAAPWIERAARELPDDDAVRTALTRVTRPEARSLIYDALFSLAASDTVSDAEQGQLDELADAWGIARDPR